MSSVALACHAMATRFELLLYGEREVALRAAGEEALAEIQRLDAQLSLYRPTSEIAHLNARAAQKAVRVEAGLFYLLRQARRLSEETGGAFDITVAPLMRCWGFMGGSGERPDPLELQEARERVGMHLVELDESEFTVRFTRPGVMLDLGAIGKGHALERAVATLIENGVGSALLHGGTSTVCALGAPPETAAWKVAIENPVRHLFGAKPAMNPVGAEPRPAAVVALKDEALSVSAVWGKSFADGQQIFGHIIDPRSGQPAQDALASAVIVPSATESDALSTALLTVGAEGFERIAALRTGLKALLITGSAGTEKFGALSRGIEVSDFA